MLDASPPSRLPLAPLKVRIPLHSAFLMASSRATCCRSMSPSLVTTRWSGHAGAGYSRVVRSFTSIFQVLGGNIYDYNLPRWKKPWLHSVYITSCCLKTRSTSTPTRRSPARWPTSSRQWATPGRSGLEHGRYPGNPRERHPAGNRLRPAWPWCGHGCEVTPKLCSRCRRLR